MNQYGLKALQFIQDNQLDQVKTAIDKSIQCSKDEQNEEDLYALAQSFLTIGFLQEALYIAQAGFDYFGYDEWLILIAEIKTDNDELEEALELLLSISETSNVYSHALLAMADIYEVQQLYDVALYKLDKAKALLPEERTIDFGRAQLLYLMGEYTQALSIYEKLIASHEIDEIILYKNISKILIALGEFEEAITYLDAIPQQEHDSDSLFALGLAYYQIQEYIRAESNFNQLLLLDPDYHSAEYYLADTYINLQSLDKAIALLEKAIANNPYDEKCYVLLYQVYQQQHTEKIELLFEKISTYLPDNMTLMLLYVDYLSYQEAYEKIIDYLLEKIEQEYEDRQFYWEIAKAYRQLEQDEAARNYYQLAEKLYDSDYQFNKDYAQFLYEVGDLITRQIVINKFKK